jgi:hypothetical protein
MSEALSPALLLPSLAAASHDSHAQARTQVLCLPAIACHASGVLSLYH